MRLLVIIFGGTDHSILGDLECPHLKQAEWGPVVVDELRNQRDVATQITGQFITGKTWRENGIGDRRKHILRFRKSWIRFLEERVFRRCEKGRIRRTYLYQAFRGAQDVSRNYLKDDLTCSTIFDRVAHSRAVYVPAYNPEPSWALGRNILDPRKYPELGVEGALDLREKNFFWRKRRLWEALDDQPYDLLMAQFQYIDSTQHLYLVYHDPEDMSQVHDAYLAMDAFAAEIQQRAIGKYDRIIFVSDNGAARKQEWKPTHHNRPFYSLSWQEGLAKPNLRDFHDHMIRWISSDVTSGVSSGER